MFWRKKGEGKKDKPLTREDVVRLLQQAGSSDKLDLSGRILLGIKLFSLDLRGANLSGADLSGANLTVALLFGANLSEAKVNLEQLGTTGLLQGAIMPDGKKH